MKMPHNEKAIRAKESKLKVTVIAVASLILTQGLALTSASAQEADVKIRMTPVMPEPNAPITPARTKARALFLALTGVPLPIDDNRLKQMEALISQGRDKDAAKIATDDPLFYDVRVKNLAKKMSNRIETVQVELNDFVATFVGVVRDSDTTSAKELLTGNFYYAADPDLTVEEGVQQVRQDILEDFLRSNRHYTDIENKGYSLKAVLKRVDGQKVVQNSGNLDVVLDHPDAAGVISSRAFMEAHALDGTNRRLVEYAFRQFMCVPITEWADANAPDDWVGRDVERTPSGSNNKYQVTCKACHTNMDALRGAFAAVDFRSGRPVINANGNPTGKMSRNNNVFPQGKVTTDSSWMSYMDSGKNAEQFGWRSPLQGVGMRDFGVMLANSRGFSQCMAKRVFTEVCKRETVTADHTMIRLLADEFERNNYNMRGLFEAVAVRSECSIQ